jgi:hypothetical protein
MADWYRWVKSTEAEIGLPEGLLDEALRVNRSESLDAILDSSPIADVLIDLVMSGEKCEDTPARWLDRISKQANQGPWNPRFPRTPHDFSVELRRLEPALLERGIVVKRGRRSGGNRERLIVLTLVQGDNPEGRRDA